MSYCKITVQGTLGRDAEIKPTQSGDTVVSFSIPHNISRDVTQWIECTYWRKPTDKMGVVDHLKKGASVLVVGNPVVEAYIKDGAAIPKQKVTVFDITICAFAPKTDGQGGSQKPAQSNYQAPTPAPAQEDEEDDLPF